MFIKFNQNTLSRIANHPNKITLNRSKNIGRLTLTIDDGKKSKTYSGSTIIKNALRALENNQPHTKEWLEGLVVLSQFEPQNLPEYGHKVIRIAQKITGKSEIHQLQRWKEEKPQAFENLQLGEAMHLILHTPLAQNKKFITKAVSINGNLLKYIPEEFKSNPKIVLVAIKSNEKALKYASKELRYDKDFNLQAVQINWKALKHAPKGFQNDPEVVDAAMKKNLQALEFSKLRENREFVLQQVTKNARALIYADNFNNDEEFVREAFQSNKFAILHAKRGLRSKLIPMLL